MKKGFLIVVFLLVLLFSVSVRAEEDFTYFLDGAGNACVTGYTGDAEDLAVPEALDGHPVTCIGREAFIGRDFSSVSLPEGVTEIGNYAFMNCHSLASVSLPEGLVRIGDSAFENCNYLGSVAFPEGLDRIGDMAFKNCEYLTNIVLPEGLAEIGDGAFDGCPE